MSSLGAAVGASAQPQLLRLAADPARWRLMTALSNSDLRVGDLARVTDLPQNLVSYHLGQLRKAELVTTRRSSADARDTFYRLDLARYATLLAETGGALHSALRLVPPPVPSRSRPRRRTRVLFLCTGNSSRSQMAEALLRERGEGSVTVRSAGSQPKPVHPLAIAVMAGYGIDLSRARPKHLDRFTAAGGTVRLRHQPVRQGPRGLSRVPRAAAPGALEHTGSGPRSSRVPGVCPRGRRPGRPDQFPAVRPGRTRHRGGAMTDLPADAASSVHVRYLVDDVQAAIDFYTGHLGFTLNTAFLPAFADVQRGNLRLLLSGPASSAGRTLPDGTCPHRAGGTASISSSPTSRDVARLRAAGVPFRSDIISGPGGRQIVLDDPAGNPWSCSRRHPGRDRAPPSRDVSAPADRPLARRLGLGDAVAIGLGSMVGAGVFSAFAPAAAAAGTGLLLRAGDRRDHRVLQRHRIGSACRLFIRRREAPMSTDASGWGPGRASRQAGRSSSARPHPARPWR